MVRPQSDPDAERQRQATAFETRSRLLRWGGKFALANALFFILVSGRYIAFMDLPTTWLSWSFLFSTTIGHFALLSFLPYFLLIVPLSFFCRRAVPLIAWTVFVYTAALSLLLVDTFVFAQYRFHLNLLYLAMLFKGGSQIIGFSTKTWLIGVTAAILLCLWEGIWAAAVWRHLNRTPIHVPGRRGGWMIGIPLILLLAVSHLIHIWADARYDRSVTRLTRYYPLLFPATAKKFMTRRGWTTPEAVRASAMLKTRQVKRGDGLHYPIAPLRCNPPEVKMNLLIVLLDSWRYDAMTPAITPNIDAFSQGALTYQAHYSGGNATRIGVFSLFYGLPGTYWHAFENNQRGPVLIDALLDNGYDTAVFASAPLNSPEFDRTVFAKIEDLSIKTPGDSTHARDEAVVRRWRGWLGNHQSQKPDTPFFGFLFFDSLHGYQYPGDYPRHFLPTWEAADYLSLNNDTDPLPFRNLYNNIAHYQDSLVGTILNDLDRRGVLENTVVLITGDHGQEFNDNKKNFWGHNSNFTRYQTQVPLILYWPGRPPARVTERTSHTDLPPTLLRNLLGCQNPPETYSVGRDLFSEERKPLTSMIMASYSSYAIVEFETGHVTVKDAMGLYDVYDHRYNVLSEAQPGTDAVIRAIEEMSRFYQ